MSEWPYDLLGVGDDADERTIKRAYAGLLKRHRPDDDPEGFQRLNEAYQAALSYRRDTAIPHSDDDGPAGMASPMPILETHQADAPATHVIPPPGTAGNSRPVAPPVDEIRLRDDLLARAAHDLPSQLRQHLAQHPDLYSLQVKRRVGAEVFERIAYEDAPLSAGNLAVLGEFFGFTPPEWIERRARVERAVQSENTAAFDEDRPLTIRQLKRPFRWPLALLLSCVPGFSIRAARLSARLASEYGDDVPGLDARQQAFFGRLADPFYAGIWRWASAMLSATVVSLAIAVLCRLTDVDPERAARVTAFVFAMVAGLLCLWHVLLALLALRERPAASRNAWLALMPVWLASAALAMAFMLPQAPALAFGLALPAALMYFRQFFDALRFGVAAAWLVQLMPVPTAFSPWLAALAGAAIGMTLCDWIYARRHRVGLAAATGNRWTTIGSFVAFVAMGMVGVSQWVLQP